MHGGGGGWNSSGMTHWLPDFQAGAQPVSLPPAPGTVPLSMMKRILHPIWSACKLRLSPIARAVVFFAQLCASCFSSCPCLCRLDRIFKHQLSELMFDGDCRRKFEFSSEPVCAHWALLWPSTLRLARPSRLRPLHLRACGLSVEAQEQVPGFKEGRSVLGPPLFSVIDRAP
jgi:hypothetical protein